MHELSVAMSIVEIALARLKESGGARVTLVKAVIGELSGAMADSVIFCYDAAARGTPAEGSRLEVERTEAEAVCGECSHRFKPLDPLAVCPSCGAFGGRIVAGEELYVDHIGID